jgi:hypothetical protein
MNREDVQKLLGGYATNTLTPAEREALFAAALEDQTLFDQLAREEALREVLQDPATRGELLAALDTRPQPWYRRFAAWLGQPAGMAAVAATAVTLTVAVFLMQLGTKPKSNMVAMVRAPAAPVRPEQPPTLGRPAPAEPPRPAPESGQSRFVRPYSIRMAPERAASPSPPVNTPASNAPPANGPALVTPTPPATSFAPGGVVGGIIPASPAGVLGGAAPPPPPPLRQELAKEASQVVADASASQPAAGSSARALFSAPPISPSFPPRREPMEEREEKQKRSAGAPAVAGQTGATAPRLRLYPQALNSVSPASAVVLPPVPHLGLRYRVLRRGTDGNFAAVDPNTVFAAGDQLRLVFEPNDTGYLYLFERGPGGAWRVLAADRIERLASYQVPRTEALTCDESGSRLIYAVFSRQPESIAGPASQDARVSGENLLVERPAQGAADRAVYVVNTSNVPVSQRVATAITLTCR